MAVEVSAKRVLPSSALEAEMMPSEELDDDDRGTNFRTLKASSFDNCASRASSKGVRNRSVVVVKWPAAKSLARSDVGNGRSATSINALPPNPKTISSNACNCCCCCELSTNKNSANPLLSSPRERNSGTNPKQNRRTRRKTQTLVMGYRVSRFSLASCNRGGVVEDSKNG
jgi:hypothetical protein